MVYLKYFKLLITNPQVFCKLILLHICLMIDYFKYILQIPKKQ